MDWASRAVLSLRRCDTMDGSFCVSALEEESALARFGKPDIFNTDQGSQFTSAAFTGTLAAAGVPISMDGRGRWMDNVFIGQPWRSLRGHLSQGLCRMGVHLKTYGLKLALVRKEFRACIRSG
jgi:putative transposase